MLPQLAHLSPEHNDSVSKCNYIQADASREASLPRMFDLPNSKKFTYVINLGGETGYSQTKEIYQLRSHTLSCTLATEAAKRSIPAFVEASTGMVYAPTRSPKKETDKLKPWNKIAKVKLQTEDALSKISGLSLVILRLAHVYGDYDGGYIARTLCMARVYQEQQRELNWLWTKDLRVNSVHVSDCVRAFWEAAQWRARDSSPAPSSAPNTTTSSRRPSLMTASGGEAPPQAPLFNIVDHGSTSQGTIASVVAAVFGIKTGFQGTLISQFARLNLDSVIDDVNEDVLQSWAEMLAKKGIGSAGPLTPFLEKEMVRDREMSLEGALFEKVVGFKYRVEGLTEDGVRGMVRSFERMGWWP